MSKKTIKDIDLKGKKVLVRCDFNVPMDEERNITDNTRIVAALPTIKYLLDNNCKVILCSHLGRPKGEVKKEFSLAPVQKELSRLLGIEVKLADDIIGKSAKNITENMKNGEVVLIENVRFDAREEANDSEFEKELEITEAKSNIELSEEQKEAIKQINNNNVCVITGGPGTGKTTIIKAIIDLYKHNEMKPVLCAPTGRAAKNFVYYIKNSELFAN